jgi:hypothetical protein
MPAVAAFAPLCRFFKLFSLILSYFVAAPSRLSKARPDGIGKKFNGKIFQIWIDTNWVAVLRSVISTNAQFRV